MNLNWLNAQHQLGPEVARLAKVSLSDMVPSGGALASFILALSSFARTEGHI